MSIEHAKKYKIKVIYLLLILVAVMSWWWILYLKMSFIKIIGCLSQFYVKTFKMQRLCVYAFFQQYWQSTDYHVIPRKANNFHCYNKMTWYELETCTRNSLLLSENIRKRILLKHIKYLVFYVFKGYGNEILTGNGL